MSFCVNYSKYNREHSELYFDVGNAERIMGSRRVISGLICLILHGGRGWGRKDGDVSQAAPL